MDPLLLLAAGAGALLLGRRKPTAAAGGGAERPPDSKGDGQADPNNLEDLAKLAGGLGVGATVAGGLVTSLVAGAIGKRLTGDDAGFVAGFTNAGYGTAFNVGRVVGKEVDVALGGTGTGLTGTTAQLTVGVAAVETALFGALASVGTLGLGALVYILGSALSDLNRLSYGQGGARKEWDKRWLAVYGNTRDKLEGFEVVQTFDDGTETRHTITELEALAIAYPFADGYMVQRNLLAYLQWMARGRGLFGLTAVSEEDHLRWGRDRGYFVIRETDGNGGMAVGPERWTEKDAGFWALFGAPPPPANRVDLFDEGTTQWSALKRPYLRGAVRANVDAYVEWMRRPHGALVKSDAEHLAYGLSVDVCRGQPTGDGLLSYVEVDVAGNIVPKSYDWRELK